MKKPTEIPESRWDDGSTMERVLIDKINYLVCYLNLQGDKPAQDSGELVEHFQGRLSAERGLVAIHQHDVSDAAFNYHRGQAHALEEILEKLTPTS